MSLPSAFHLNTWRNRLAQRLANAALTIADDDYRTLISGSIRYGLNSAARDILEDQPAPPSCFRDPSDRQ